MNRRELLGILAAVPITAIGIKAQPSTTEDGEYHGWTHWAEHTLTAYTTAPVVGVWQRWNARRQEWLVSPTHGPLQWVEPTGVVDTVRHYPWQPPLGDPVTERHRRIAYERLEAVWNMKLRRVEFTSEWGQEVLDACVRAGLAR